MVPLCVHTCWLTDEFFSRLRIFGPLLLQVLARSVLFRPSYMLLTVPAIDRHWSDDLGMAPAAAAGVGGGGGFRSSSSAGSGRSLHELSGVVSSVNKQSTKQS